MTKTTSSPSVPPTTNEAPAVDTSGTPPTEQKRGRIYVHGGQSEREAVQRMAPNSEILPATPAMRLMRLLDFISHRFGMHTDAVDYALFDDGHKRALIKSTQCTICHRIAPGSVEVLRGEEVPQE